MDELKHKAYHAADYTCRTNGVPSYYNEKDRRWVMGIGSNMKKDNAWLAHKIKQEDTFDSLALEYYNNPSYWWVIAYFNDIDDPFAKLADLGDIIRIPNISGIEFGAFR